MKPPFHLDTLLLARWTPAMGRNRPKTPTQILKDRGSWRGVARAKQEPAAVAGELTTPSFLKKEGKREWNRQLENLKAQGLLSTTYRNALAIYCQAWGEYYDACQALADNEVLIFDDSTGEVIPNPSAKKLLELRATALQTLMRLGPQFGWSPATKADVKKDTPAPKALPQEKPAEAFTDPEDFFKPRVVG